MNEEPERGGGLVLDLELLFLIFSLLSLLACLQLFTRSSQKEGTGWCKTGKKGKSNGGWGKRRLHGGKIISFNLLTDSVPQCSKN